MTTWLVLMWFESVRVAAVMGLLASKLLASKLLLPK